MLVISSDQRATPVYAVTYEGNFSIQDTAVNYGLKDFFKRAEEMFTMGDKSKHRRSGTVNAGRE